jgi:hypothetical protein
MGGASAIPIISRHGGFAGAQAILVIAQSDIVWMFREEWPAAACIPRQAAGNRIELILSCFGCPGAMERAAARA